MIANSLNPLFVSAGLLKQEPGNNFPVKVFSSIELESKYLNSSAALRDTSSNSKIKLTGSEDLSLINRISTNKVDNLQNLHAVRTIFTNDKGRILDSQLLINFSGFRLLYGSPGKSLLIYKWIDRFIISDDVSPSDTTLNDISFEIIGPHAASVAVLLFGNEVDKLEINTAGIYFIESDGYHVIKTTEFNGEIKFVVLSTMHSIKKIIEISANYTGPIEFGWVGDEAYELYRIQNLIPSENELNDEFNPHEIKLLNEVSFTKGCYIGQEVIARLDTYDKVQKFLTPIVFNSGLPPDLPAQLYDDENKDAGVLTSVYPYGDLDQREGLAVVRKKHLEPGIKLKLKNEILNDFETLVTIK